MGNQCCQSTTTQDEQQISSNSETNKIQKAKSKEKTQEIPEKQETPNKINNHVKENGYESADQEDRQQQGSDKQQIEKDKTKSVQNIQEQQSIQQQKEEEAKKIPTKQQSVQSNKNDKIDDKTQQNGANGVQSQNQQQQDQIPTQANNEQETKATEQQNIQEKQQQQEKAAQQQQQQQQQQKQAQQKSEKLDKSNQKEKEKRQSQKSVQSKDKGGRQNKPKQSLKEFQVSADIFIHLKQGNISDEYKIGETLGEGAFGHVSKVTHKSTNMIRAMKCIKKSSLIKEEEQKMFSEMNILKNLDHPNIVRLYELYQDQKCYYLITEYCSGGELFDKIKSLTHFTERMAAEYMKQLLSAIFYCHQNKIVHRDLKPENLILESDKKGAPLKVIDFGTSRKFDSNKKMTKRLGTPYYIAPEVLGQKYDEKCDVWSCGVILYILLCGYPPFGGRTEEEILKKVKQGKVRFDPEDWDKMSNESKNLIKKMLTLDPKKRISAEQALNDPWVNKHAPQLQISSKALGSLAQFYTKSKLKQTIMTFIVSQLVSREEKDELQKTFRQLDKNGDGRLSHQELVEGYYKVYGDRESAQTHVDRIMKMVDTNNSGVVDFTEFLMAAMQREQMLSKQKIETAFKLFDQDGNGYITREELQTIIGEIDDQFWQQILSECDTNKDGKISQNEFIELLIKKKL